MSKPDIYYQNKFDMHSSLSGAQRWTPHAEYECINSYVELEDYEKAMKALDILSKAVEFYADVNNWENPSVIKDPDHKAKNALDELRTIGFLK